jgi:hemerythrin superfamily protein
MGSIFEHLREDHEILGTILRRIRRGERDVEPRVQLLLFQRELIAHDRAEENVFYSYLIHEPSLQQRAIASLADHAQIEERLAAVEHALSTTQALGPLVDALYDELRQHLREEETHMFSQARRILTERAAAELGARFVQERARIHRDISGLDEGLREAAKQL